MVEGDRGAEEGVDDVRVVVELLVNHEGKDAHLSSTAVVELDGQLLVDGLLVPAGGLELSSLDVILASSVAELDEADEEHDLGSSPGRDGIEGGKTGLHGGERYAVGDVTRKADTSSGNEVAEDGKHGDAAVLGLHLTEAVEALLVGILEESKRVPESKGRLGSDGVLEAHLECGGLAAHASGGEGGGAEEGGEDGDELEHGVGLIALKTKLYGRVRGVEEGEEPNPESCSCSSGHSSIEAIFSSLSAAVLCCCAGCAGAYAVYSFCPLPSLGEVGVSERC